MSNTTDKKNPQRMCIACRKMMDKRALLRVVRSPEGQISVDIGGKKNGRGAYVCGEEACIVKCSKGLLSKHLGCEIPPEIYEEIRSIHRVER